MLSNFFGRKKKSASVGIDTTPKYMIPPSRPYNPPLVRGEPIETAIKTKLQIANAVADELPRIYKQTKTRAEASGVPNPFERLIYHLDPATIPDSEHLRRTAESRLAYLAKREQGAVNRNLGLVMAEARGIPRDVVLNHISPFLQPTEREQERYLQAIQDETARGTRISRSVMDKVPQLMEYPDVPITFEQERVLGDF